MGVSIVLYRAPTANSIEELVSTTTEIASSASINLYKITEDLGIIFMDTADPHADLEALPYKILFGEYVAEEIGDRVINGFVSSQQVATFYDWLTTNKLDSVEGFSTMYGNLSEEAKQALIDIRAADQQELYEGYVAPLVHFYREALLNKNSIVICGE